MNTIRAYASQDAHVIYGTAYDDSLGDEIRVTVVATGLSRVTARRVVPSLQVLRRNGTDNMAYDVEGLSENISMSVSSTSANSQPNYQVPPYLRKHPDRTSAAAKVDALSSGGMGDFEIPAFLRKQAD
jgi:cell division protein FtsZ